MFNKILLGLGAFVLTSQTALALPKMTAVGDFGFTTSSFRNTLTNMNAQAPDFHIALGDLAYEEATPADWCAYVDSKLAQPFVFVMGNHDVEVAAHEAQYKEFCPDRMDQTGDYARQSYFDYGGARFISIDPTIAPTRLFDYNITEPKGMWLKNKIEEGHAAGLWVVVNMHVPCIVAGSKGCEIGEQLMNDLVKWQPDLILAGHKHAYERTKQLYWRENCWVTGNSYDADCVRATSTYPDYPAGGTHVVVNGTGGRYLQNIDETEGDYPYLRVSSGADKDPSHGPTTVYIGETCLRIKYSTNADGVLDEFRICR